MRGVLVILFVALFGACATDRCKEGTALLSFTLLDGAEAATSFDVTVTSAGMTQSQNVARKTKRTSGSIEVDFAQYPSGQPIVVELAARAGDQVLATSTLSITASPGCTVVNVTLDGRGVDLALDDLTSSGDGLIGGDGSTSDSSLDGARPSPDLRSASSTEDCFNGIDDDGNGLVDCADPHCGGVGECVPDPAGAGVPWGTLGSPCPTTFPSETPLFATLNPGACILGSCACANGFNSTPTCSAMFFATNSMCLNNAGTVFAGTDTSGCLSFSALSSTTDYDLTITFSGDCSAPTDGPPTKVAPTWSVTNAFCAGSPVGGGCAGGQICVPVAPNHCVLEIGDQAACTVSGYSVPNATHFFTGFDDSTRDCSCTCDPDGTCSVGFGNGSCNTTTPGGAACGTWPAYDHALVHAPAGAMCEAEAVSAGATSTAGFERTVCCIH